jgi:hypothetical protein
VPTRLAALCCLLAASGWLSAAEPTVRNVNVRGFQVGGTTTVTIDGDDLGKPFKFLSPFAKAPKLLLPFPAKQTLKPGYTDKKAEFEVTLADDVTPGLYHLRTVTEGGVSLPVVVGVDRLRQVALAAKIDALPVAAHGSLSGATVAETTFTGKANEKVTIEIEAQRIGSKLRPVVHLYNAKKLQLAWAWGTPALAGDARLEVTLPADGTYTLTLHDAEYAGAAPGHFRLKAGTFGYVDQVFPTAAARNSTSAVLFGSTTLAVPIPPPKRTANVIDWPKDGNWTGPRPWLEMSDRAEFTPTPGSAAAIELPAGAVGVSGKLTKPDAEDRYKVPVKPNTKVRFEVFAERIGSPLDTSLVIRNDAGAVLAQAEDSPRTIDPALEYAVPDKVTSVTVGVLDATGRGGPRGIYRLTVDPVTPEGRGDFRLTTPAQRLTLPAGGRVVLPVFAERRGYLGPIDFLQGGLPAGVKVEGATIPYGADGTLVTLSGVADAASVSGWVGRGGGFSRDVIVAGHPLERIQPWLAMEIVIAATSAKVADFAVDWKNLPPDAGLSPGGKLALPVTVKRLDPAAPVRLVLLTSQAPPLTNGQPDPNRALRAEKPVELAAKAADAELPLVIPAELPADSYQIAVQAELLSADKQKVLATAVTPVRTLPVKLPVAVKADAPKVEAKLDAKGAMIEVTGTAERLNGFAGDIAVSLAGLPAGVPVPAPVTVKAGETKFAIKLALPVATPPGEVKLKLSATAAPDPKQPNVRVKSREVTVTLNVIAEKK